MNKSTCSICFSNFVQMDHTFECIINVIFYFIMYCIILSILGLEPLVLFASVSGFILAFAFMIGAACSKYFEGIIFILIRRPYGMYIPRVLAILLFIFISIAHCSHIKSTLKLIQLSLLEQISVIVLI
jgi:hypothetical protein